MRVNTTSEDIVQWRKDIEHLRNILSKHRTTTFGEDMGTTQVTPGSIPKNEKDELSSQRLNTQVTHLVFVEGNLTDNNPNNYEKVLEIQRTAVKWDNETYGDIMHVDCVENLEYGKTYQISIVAQQERRLVKRQLSDQNESSSEQSDEQSDQDSISTTALVSPDSESSRGAEDPTLNQLKPTNSFEVLGECLSITPCLEYLLTIGSMREEKENAEDMYKIHFEEEELRLKKKREAYEIFREMEKEKRKNRERIICESMSNVTKEWDNMEKQIKEKKQLESELATVKADFRGLQIQIAKLESSIAIIESQHKLVAKQKEEVCKKNKEYLSKVGREFSHKYTHVMKTDDDSFINIPGTIVL